MNKAESIEEAKKRGLKWVAMDADGEWFGYDDKPTTYRGAETFCPSASGRCEKLGISNFYWRDTLTEVL